MKYIKGIDGIKEEQVDGFFVGWPNPPSNNRFLDMLRGSFFTYLALDGNKVVGFVNVISDGVLSAYIPLLEVLPSHQGKGIGSKLMTLAIEDLKTLYMIDLACDPDKKSYYEQLGFTEATCMMIRNYENQNGVINL